VSQPGLFDDVPDDGPPRTIQQRFEAFHAANPAVYRKLCELTTDLVAKGRTRLGIGMLWEVLRWHWMMTTADAASDFKLNDHYRSRYVRLMLAERPEWDGVFELRNLRA
jgi:hypothetical protein